MTILWTATALNREQKKILAQHSTIEHARDVCHADASARQYPPIVWATGYYHIVGITEDGANVLTPYSIRYILEQESPSNAQG